MRNSQKNGLLKSLTAMLIVVLVAALTLTGCSDKTARELANQALTAAQNAQDAADKAQTSANNAQNSADGAQDSADSNKNVIDSLPDSEAVAKVVQDILNKYVKGAELTEDSIITIGELETFLASDEVATLLAQYVTIDALADYAKAADLNGLREQFTTAQQQITAAMGTYVTKTAYEADKATLNGTIESLTTQMTDALKTLATKAELKAEIEKVVKNFDNYVTKSDVYTKSELYTKAEIDEIIGDIDFNELIKDLQDYADAAVLESEKQYEAATKYVIEAINNINAKLAAYAEVKDSYDPNEYAKMVAKYEQTKLELLRAQRVTSLKDADGNVVIKGAEDIVADTEDWIKENVNNLAADLIDALAAITYPIIVPVDHIKDDAYVSLDEINACWAIIEQAKAQLGADSDAYKIDFIDSGLYEEVELAQSTYDNLVAAKNDANGEGAEALINSILAIPAYADITVDMTDARVALKAAVEYVSNITYHEWKQHYFVNDEENVNIARILGAAISADAGAPTVLDYYMNAIAKVAALAKLDEEAAALNKKIVDTLTGNGWYANGYVLYSEFATLDALNTEVAEWIKTNNVKTATVVLPNYNDLTAADGAYAYAKRMNDAYVKANEADGLIAKLDEALALDLVLKSEEKINAAYNALNAWVSEYTVDAANKTAIITDARINGITAAYERMIVLNNAKEAAKAINDKIDALGKEGVVFIGSMPEIREIRNEIVTWLNTYNIVPEKNEASAIADWIANANTEAGDVVLAVTGDYLADNYDMIKHAELDAIIAAYNAIVREAIADAKKAGGVIELIDKIDSNDKFMLYQFRNINRAWQAYYTWVEKFNVPVVDISHLDFGEGDLAEEAEGILVEHYLKLANDTNNYNTVFEAAYKQYASDITNAYGFFFDDKLAIKAEADITVTVKDGAAIKAAVAASKAWFDKYIDPARLWNEEIDAIIADPKSEEILTEELYTLINNIDAKYEALVLEAKTAGEAIVYDYAVNVYNKDKLDAAKKAYDDWAAKYGIVYDDYAGTALDARLAGMQNVIDTITTKIAEYEKLVAELKTEFAALKTKIDALNKDVITIYYETVIDPIRAEYDAWAKKAGLTDNTSAAFTDEIDDAAIKAFKDTVVALETAEKDLDEIEKAKFAETETVQGLINNLPAADKVTTADREAIEAARAAYETWLAGKGNDLYKVDNFKIDAANTKYTVDTAKLLAAEGALAAIDAKLNVVENEIAEVNKAIEDLKNTDPADEDAYQKALEAVKDAIEDADKAIDEFYEINGGENHGGIEVTFLQSLAAAKMQYAAAAAKADATVKANANYDAICGEIDGALAEALLNVWAKTIEEYETKYNEEGKDLFDDILVPNFEDQVLTIVQKDRK